MTRSPRRAPLLLCASIVVASLSWLPSNALARPRAGSAHSTSSRSARIAVQPIEGPGGEALRATVVRLVRARGFRTVTTIPRQSGTGQYPELARTHRLCGFITADVEERASRQSVTFLVWNGRNGSVIGRWSTSAPARRLHRTVARGFWRNLAHAMLNADTPPSGVLRPAPPMRIDASADDQPLAVQ